MSSVRPLAYVYVRVLYNLPLAGASHSGGGSVSSEQHYISVARFHHWLRILRRSVHRKGGNALQQTKT